LASTDNHSLSEVDVLKSLKKYLAPMLMDDNMVLKAIDPPPIMGGFDVA
jgi:hypothetical protein